jgi:hypothetical protein
MPDEHPVLSLREAGSAVVDGLELKIVFAIKKGWGRACDPASATRAQGELTEQRA